MFGLLVFIELYLTHIRGKP